MARIAGRFARVEPRRRARAFVLGLLAELPRKNCWTIAEYAGDAIPADMQHLLSRASWDADEVPDDIRDFVVEYLGNEDADLVVDETGDLKKGTAGVGVQRQYTNTAGGRYFNNCQRRVSAGLFGRVAVPMCGRAIRVSARRGSGAGPGAVLRPGTGWTGWCG